MYEIFLFCQMFFVSPTRFERVTYALEVRDSIQLSYGDKYHKVSRKGIEPLRPAGHKILSLARLPIPPP